MRAASDKGRRFNSLPGAEFSRAMLKEDELTEQVATPARAGGGPTAKAPDRRRHPFGDARALSRASSLSAPARHIADGAAAAVRLFSRRYPSAWTDPSSFNTGAGAFVAFVIAIYLFRRVVTLPGVGVVGHVLPAITAGYGIVFAVILALGSNIAASASV